MKIITSDKIPKPGGHYSPCIEHNGVLYISGQLPFVPGSRDMADNITDQTIQVLTNLELILNESGSSKNQILQVRIYIPDIAHWEEVNRVYTNFMGAHKPVRCVVPTRDLHYGCLIEVEATAYI